MVRKEILSFITETVGNGIILDNFTASRGNREAGRRDHKWSLNGDCISFPFLSRMKQLRAFVITDFQ